MIPRMAEGLGMSCSSSRGEGDCSVADHLKTEVTAFVRCDAATRECASGASSAEHLESIEKYTQPSGGCDPVAAQPFSVGIVSIGR